MISRSTRQQEIERINLSAYICSWLSNIRRTLKRVLGHIPDRFREVANEVLRVTRDKIAVCVILRNSKAGSKMSRIPTLQS
jgi:hypothetical protein